MMPFAPATLHNIVRLFPDFSTTTPIIPLHNDPANGDISTNAPTGIDIGRYIVGEAHESDITPIGSKLPDGYIESPIYITIHQYSIFES